MRKSKIATVVTFISLGIAMTGCSTINRVVKNVQVNTTGLNRKVTVYSDNGDIIKEYEGKNMTVTDGDGGTITIDFEGKRVTICNSNVIIEEVGAE